MSSIALRKEQKGSIMTAICMLAFVLSNISYLPYFADNGMTQYLSYPAWGLMIGTILMYRQFYMDKRDIKFGLFVLVIFAAMGIYGLITGKDYYGSLLTKCIFLALIITVLGSVVAKVKVTWGAENSLLWAYVVATFVLCTVVFFEYLIDQDITSRIYSYRAKNETAFLAASSFVILLYLPPAPKYKKLQVLFRILLAAFFFYVIVGMRCRSMLFAVLVTLAIFLFQRNSSKGFKAVIVLGAFALLIAMQNEAAYDKLVNGILLGGRETNDVNDLTSGRLVQIARGWELFKQNLLFGTGDIGTVDCFFVSVLMQYGAPLGLCLMILGCYPFVWGVYNYKRIKSPVCMVMILCAMMYIIGGIFEENAPFGPGTRCYISWFLFGYLRAQQASSYFVEETHEENRTA